MDATICKDALAAAIKILIDGDYKIDKIKMQSTKSLGDNKYEVYILFETGIGYTVTFEMRYKDEDIEPKFKSVWE